MDSKLASAYEEIASGHKKLAEYYSSLATSSSSLDLSPESPKTEIKAELTPKAVKKPKDPNAPKRPMSSYLIYANEQRDALKEKHPEWSYQDITRELGNMWKTSDHTKYEDIANSLMEEYKVQMGGYQKSKECQSSEQPSVDASLESKTKKAKKDSPKKEKATDSSSPAFETIKIETPKKSASSAVPATVPVAAAPIASPLKEKKDAAVVASGSEEVKEKKKKKKQKHTDGTEPASPSKAETSDELTQQDQKKAKKRKHDNPAAPVTIQA